MLGWQYQTAKQTRSLLNNQSMHQETDKRTYIKVQSLLRNNNLMLHIRQDNFLSRFDNDIFSHMNQVIYECHAAPVAYEFFNKELDNLFKELLKELYYFHDHLATNTWCLEANLRFSHIPPEWTDTDPDRYEEVTQELLLLKEKVCEVYDNFTRAGRYKFGDTCIS
jgi:hypothetical protein